MPKIEFEYLSSYAIISKVHAEYLKKLFVGSNWYCF